MVDFKQIFISNNNLFSRSLLWYMNHKAWILIDQHCSTIIPLLLLRKKKRRVFQRKCSWYPMAYKASDSIKLVAFVVQSFNGIICMYTVHSVLLT